VAKILGGAKPADLPSELPSKFELVVNQKAARLIGHRIPQVRAGARRPGDRVNQA
jgi:putative ABC transport system substrate-binding protein